MRILTAWKSAPKVASAIPKRYIQGPPGGFKRPSPPPLGKEEQEEWNRLQKESSQKPVDVAQRTRLRDFEGNVNPETGEVGGPKKEPTIHGDYSYGGRVTDF
ncbi:mitochondrial respiratory chain complex II assembly factor 4 Sdh8 [Schizosaccharomyces osmophilus]|uniref:Succinate dehydrogenase assembly factor 4, mitochondrial n=1 Tax=Schizosaccharomyces osmophilus TaxID=2545709 RepID=A0AAE9WA17_9SCHI|nr:mitochondrial respiratory chain complex II assembly factor 4 Sdh8 [Schizosaccharomyces osmophilus]WBW71571.1 mitochondrial respiratory chain complex II assembly factor 4 Sdh8 [Schizosaccharomyces osmophilus]